MVNIDKCRVDANNTEYHIVSKSIFLKIIISKFMMINLFFHVEMYVKNVCLKWTYGLYGDIPYIRTYGRTDPNY